MQMGYQHLFDTAILQVVLDRVECSEDDALDMFEIQLQTQNIEQSVDGMQRLFHFFDKENDVLFWGVMVFCTCDGRIT